jgi:hypothetical protein
VIYIEETVRGAIMHMHLYVHVVFFHVCFYAKVILKRFLILPIVEQRMKKYPYVAKDLLILFHHFVMFL